jgi:hypothetical protein
MNIKLIQQLAEEARLITVNGQTRYALAEEFEQRFAELIVQECINACGSDFGTELIKKHFGVEE